LLDSLLQEMERWLKILLGTVFGSIGSLIFFLIFDRIFQYFRKLNIRKSGGHQAVPMRVRRKEQAEEMKEEMEQLIYEEYDTESHEVLAICLETETTAVSICVFLKDREIEFYVEKFPECCVRHHDGEDYVYRNMMTAISLWGAKWTYAEAVNFLVRDVDLVKAVSKSNTRQWRSVDKFEQRHSFKFFIQWTDNYVCDEVANDELWEELLNTAKSMLNSSETEMESVWDNFPVNHWRRKRIRVNGVNFHHIPHPGEVSDSSTKTEEDPTKTEEEESTTTVEEMTSVAHDLVSI